MRDIAYGLPSTNENLRFDLFDYRLLLWEKADHLAGQSGTVYSLNASSSVTLVNINVSEFFLPRSSATPRLRRRSSRRPSSST